MPPTEQYQDIHFPKGGIDLSRAAMAQPWRQGPVVDGEQTRIYTCAVAENVRSFDSIARRIRGGARSGLSRYISAAPIPGWLVQHLNTVVGVDPNNVSQTSQLGRVVTGILVCQGRVFTFEPSYAPPVATTEATNSSSSTPPLNFSGIVSSAPNNQKLWMVDGTHYRRFTPITNVVDNWTASAGTIPVDGSGNGCRLITTWRGRTVVSGLVGDPANWFMSATSDPTDFDYSPTSQTPTQAVAGNNSRLGFIGDVVTALMAYNDDTMVFGGNTSLWMMRGDPMMGGELDLITSSIGACFGEAFTQDPKGNIYFMANTGSIYILAPQSMPERISTPIDKIIQDIDTGKLNVRMEWDERQRGCNVFITTLEKATQSDFHLFWEYPTNCWTKMTYANKKHNPLASCTIDGNTVSDRVVLIGGWDGWVRSMDPNAADDDNVPIASKVLIGPLLTKDFDEIVLKSVQAVLAQSSGDVDWAILAGATAEEALASDPLDRASGTWSAGRNSTEQTIVAGHAIYIQLESTKKWAMEAIRAALSTNLSKIRRRGA